jgi:hypothetical protein
MYYSCYSSTGVLQRRLRWKVMELEEGGGDLGAGEGGAGEGWTGMGGRSRGGSGDGDGRMTTRRERRQGGTGDRTGRERWAEDGAMVASICIDDRCALRGGRGGGWAGKWEGRQGGKGGGPGMRRRWWVVASASMGTVAAGAVATGRSEAGMVGGT